MNYFLDRLGDISVINMIPGSAAVWRNPLP